MTYTSAYALGPGKTPGAIAWIISLTCLMSFCAALLEPLFVYYFQISGPNTFFSLSWHGLKEGYLWQPVTYLFIEDGFQGVTFSLLIALFFQMYILWIMGTSLIERVGSSSFVWFYLFCGMLCGLATVLSAAPLGQHPLLTGPGGSIIALWVVWTMMHPESEVLLFFILPLKAKWLLAFVLGALLLVNLSQGNFVALLYYFTSAAAGHLYGVIAWGLEGPFSWSNGLDKAILHLKAKFSKKSAATSVFSGVDTTKIIDINTGKPFLDDDLFVDTMLAKISQTGEDSLTWSERRRLRKISEKRTSK